MKSLDAAILSQVSASAQLPHTVEQDAGLCPSCGVNQALDEDEAQVCPWRDELEGDDNVCCCCSDCREDCADAI